jgi:hypothetical protein
MFRPRYDHASGVQALINDLIAQLDPCISVSVPPHCHDKRIIKKIANEAVHRTPTRCHARCLLILRGICHASGPASVTLDVRRKYLAARRLHWQCATVSQRVEEKYRVIQRLMGDIKAPEVGVALSDLFQECLRFLRRVKRVELESKIPGKQYFAFELGKKISRAINKAEYDPDPSEWDRLLKAVQAGDASGFSIQDDTRAVYAAAVSFCAIIDLTKSGDQKTPGTFFEYLIGHLFASRLGVNPRTRLPVLNLDMDTTLPTDFVFDLGANRAKFHLPIKTSTRERVIQVWAHQRVLDGVYGTGRFIGTPVILAETKTDTKKREVIEICLPDQWRIYQMHIAQLKRIYYLDVPVSYARLNEVFPPLCVRPFGEYFVEVDTLISSPS